ncbi:MAG: DUF1028 domain-containing protein [Lapillicoccus sp.]
MTFSIAATLGDAVGVAVASKFLAVGAIVPEVRIGVGAVATQASARVSYRADVLALLAQGLDAQAAVSRVTSADEGRETRQLGVATSTGAATYTGSECMDWAGGVAGGDETIGHYAIQGNILTGADVVTAMETAFIECAGMPFDRRLLAALLAGDAAGGDSRGRQGAALVVHAPGAGYDGGGILVDLRADDHPRAPQELARLLDLQDLYFGTPQDVQPLTGDLGEEVTRRLAALGHTGPDVDTALESWSGVENYEMLLGPGGIDARVLEALRAATPDVA